MSTENPVKTYRVVLVDDHAIFRSGLRADLAHDIEIAGEAGTVEEAIKVIHEQQPDVVLLDVHLPGGRGGGGAEVLKDFLHGPVGKHPVLSVERVRRGSGRGDGDPQWGTRVCHQEHFRG